MLNPQLPDQAGTLMETGRLEAFSDGVFAIAITLLVLDIHVPRGLHGESEVRAALRDQWPVYLAFVTSFAFIGIMWINHHRLFTHIRRTDNTLLLLNLGLLLGVTLLPFPTALVAEYLTQPGQLTAALVYNGLFLLIAVVFNVLWRYAAHGNRLLDPQVNQAAVQAISRQYAVGPLLYLVTFGLAFVSVPVSLTVSLLLALFFALPSRAPRPTGDR